MRGIVRERLKVLLDSFGNHTEIIDIYNDLLDECQELQEPWMALDEFLKSGFVGLCWVEFPSEIVTDAYYDGLLFKHSSTSDFAHDVNYITHVMPIHKPEPPR